MDLKLLRETTRPEHEATEAMVPLMHPELTREEYVAVLERFFDVIRAWERVAATDGPAQFQGLLQHRQRAEALQADLEFFGAPVSADIPVVLVDSMRDLLGGPKEDPALRNSRFLGMMYVVEGSTLGGQYIASHVETTLHLQPDEGDRYFRGYGADTMPKWREFQQILREIPDTEAAETIAAAKGMFRVFGQRLSPHFIWEPGTFVERKGM